jgi:hypothetical protein
MKHQEADLLKYIVSQSHLKVNLFVAQYGSNGQQLIESNIFYAALAFVHE